MKPLLFCLLLLPFCGYCQVQIDRNYFEQLLARKEYKRVFVEGNELLKKPYGKTSHLTYYYIGRSLCGRGFSEQGKEWFRYIKQKLRVDKPFWTELQTAESMCSSNQTAVPQRNNSIIIVNNSYTPSVPGGIRGKGGFVLGCTKDVSENYERLRRNDSLGERLFPVHQKAAAIRKLRSFLPNEYKIDSAGRFLVVSLATDAYYQNDVAKVTASLEFAYRYFSSEYGLRPTDKLFTVYLLPSRYRLQQAARAVHDINISDANIGYSSLSDLSLLGIARPNSVGTLFHELFHLVIRSEIGDISPWLDEGMACLYSVYRIENNQLKGADDTWRVGHFKLLMNLKTSEKVPVPSLRQLLQYNWMDFEGGPANNLCVASANYALSNLFLLYLQQKKLLQKTVETFKNRQQLATDPMLPGPDDTKLMEQVFGQNLEAVANAFYAWVKQKYSIDLPALIQQRPTYSTPNLPLEFQMQFYEVDSLLARLEQPPQPLSKTQVQQLKTERKNLLLSVQRTHENYLRRQGDFLSELAGRDMDASFSQGGENMYEEMMRGRRQEVQAFIKTLQQKAKSP